MKILMLLISLAIVSICQAQLEYKVRKPVVEEDSIAMSSELQEGDSLKSGRQYTAHSVYEIIKDTGYVVFSLTLSDSIDTLYLSKTRVKSGDMFGVMIGTSVIPVISFDIDVQSDKNNTIITMMHDAEVDDAMSNSLMKIKRTGKGMATMKNFTYYDKNNNIATLNKTVLILP